MIVKVAVMINRAPIVAVLRVKVTIIPTITVAIEIAIVTLPTIQVIIAIETVATVTVLRFFVCV